MSEATVSGEGKLDDKGEGGMEEGRKEGRKGGKGGKEGGRERASKRALCVTSKVNPCMLCMHIKGQCVTTYSVMTVPTPLYKESVPGVPPLDWINYSLQH